MILSKRYRKLKLMRNGTSFASPESGHYEVERTSILLPITLAEDYNYNWQQSGVFYDELPEEEQIAEEVIVEPIKQTNFRKPTNAEVRAKAKELGYDVKPNSKIEDMLNYIREKNGSNN